MTTYNFETMTADQAANFSQSDVLIFTTSTLLPSDVVVSNSENGLDLTTITAEGKSLVFSGAQLQDNIKFTSSFVAGTGNTLVLGSSGNDHLIDPTNGNNIFHGFSGDDSIRGGDGDNLIFGGAGSDTIISGDGNDHIYGYDLSGKASLDGADSISGGGGNDYIQGNAGNDTLNGGDGNDRISGGADNDYIQGDTGNDTVNGNKGNDTILGDDGNDSLRGGQGDDRLFGGNGNDIILGDEGNDTIVGGAGIDVMTGGNGADQFRFSGSDAHFDVSGPLAYFTDTITDFHHGTDTIDIGGAGIGTDSVLHTGSGIEFTTLSAAVSYAQHLLDGAGTAAPSDVVALNVGSDAYLLYESDSSSTTIDSAIKLSGVDASTITHSDFVSGPPSNPGIYLMGSGYFQGTELDDTLIGSAGFDGIIGGPGIDVITGGGGNDYFGVFEDDSPILTYGGNIYTDTITDFNTADRLFFFGHQFASGDTNDEIAPTDVIQGGSFATGTEALAAADSLLSAHAGAMIVTQVGSDTYLFYDNLFAAGDANAAIKLANFAASDFTTGNIFS
jgi:serralysin